MEATRSELVVGALSSGYVNAANIGIAVALYVLGDAAASAPVILFQLLVLSPIAFTILDYNTSGRVSLGASSLVRFNPIIVATLLGVAVSLIGIELPMPILEPFRVIGAAAVPMILLSFGMSLSGTRILAPGSDRRDVILASILKLVIMPLTAWALADFVLGLEGRALFVVVVLASLPTAQNVFNYAQHYGRGVIVARDTALVTSVGAVPLLMIVAAFLAPS